MTLLLDMSAPPEAIIFLLFVLGFIGVIIFLLAKNRSLREEVKILKKERENMIS